MSRTIFDNKQNYFDVYLLGENFTKGVESNLGRQLRSYTATYR